VVFKGDNKKRKIIKLMAVNLKSKLDLRGDGFAWLFIKAIYKDGLVKEVDYNSILLD
jgi:hypothetical protein